MGSLPTHNPVGRGIGAEDRYALDNLRCSACFVLLGLVTSYTLGGFVHILLVAAIVIILFRFIQGRRGII